MVTGFGTFDIRKTLNFEFTGRLSINSTIAFLLATKGSAGSFRVGTVTLRPSALAGPVKSGKNVKLFSNRKKGLKLRNGTGSGEGGPGH